MSVEHTVIVTFEKNATQVYELMDFDEKIVAFLREALAGLVRRQTDATKPIPPAWSASPLLKLVESIRQNNSLEPYYSQMFNQCLVLLVSHFSSAIRELYMGAVAEGIRERTMLPGLAEEQLSVRIADITEPDADLSRELAHLLASKKGTSFQDMQSVARAFNDHLGYQPVKDADTDNIIIAHACRHAIVHDGAQVNSRTIRQIRNTNNATLSVRVHEGERLQFRPTDVQAVGSSMLAYLGRAVEFLASNPIPPLPEWPKGR
jgi:hypothetical protein